MRGFSAYSGRFPNPFRVHSTLIISLFDAILAICKAHNGGEDDEFRSIVRGVIENERRANRTVWAAELERIMSSSASSPRTPKRGTFTPLNGSSAAPKDKDKDAPLLDISEPQRDLDSLVLGDETRASLDRIVTEWKRSDTLAAFGFHPARKVLFCGPPGCGKSAAAESLARALRLPLATVRFDAALSSYLGETAANLRKVFEYARTHPVVLFFDEFDAVGKGRAAQDDHGEMKRVVASFLQLLDSFRADTLTIAATNYEGQLDPAIWRRFDEVVPFPPPSLDQIESLLTRLFRQFRLEPGVRIRALSASLSGVSHADVERTAIDAMKTAVIAGQSHVPAAALEQAAARLKQRLSLTRPVVDAPAPTRRRTTRKRPPE